MESLVSWRPDHKFIRPQPKLTQRWMLAWKAQQIPSQQQIPSWQQIPPRQQIPPWHTHSVTATCHLIQGGSIVLSWVKGTKLVSLAHFVPGRRSIKDNWPLQQQTINWLHFPELKPHLFNRSLGLFSHCFSCAQLQWGAILVGIFHHSDIGASPKVILLNFLPPPPCVSQHHGKGYLQGCVGWVGGTPPKWMFWEASTKWGSRFMVLLRCKKQVILSSAPH